MASPAPHLEQRNELHTHRQRPCFPAANPALSLASSSMHPGCWELNTCVCSKCSSSVTGILTHFTCCFTCFVSRSHQLPHRGLQFRPGSGTCCSQRKPSAPHAPGGTMPGYLSHNKATWTDSLHCCGHQACAPFPGEAYSILSYDSSWSTRSCPFLLCTL